MYFDVWGIVGCNQVTATVQFSDSKSETRILWYMMSVKTNMVYNI
jgi:hypothetical protein